MNLQPAWGEFAVSDQITVDDVAMLANEGYVTIVCNRPDDEEPGQPTAADIAASCEAHGIGFHHLPFQGSQIPAGTPERFAEIVNASDGRVLAYCRSGQRSGYLFMMSRALLDP